MNLSDRNQGVRKKIHFPAEREPGNVWSLGWISLTLISGYSTDRPAEKLPVWVFSGTLNAFDIAGLAQAHSGNIREAEQIPDNKSDADDHKHHSLK